MPLIDTGEHQIVLFHTYARATDGDGHLVSVKVSQEVIQDKGWDAAFQMASDKYDAGHFELKDGVKIVPVITSDWTNA